MFPLMKDIMRFGKKDKLNPCYIGLFEVPDCIGPMAYILDLPPSFLDSIKFFMCLY